MRSLGQPVGSLAADLIGVSMITCKNDRLLELLWFVGYLKAGVKQQTAQVARAQLLRALRTT